MADAQTVYVDDSGTDGKSRVVAAAFCVSTEDRWLALMDVWGQIAERAGFELKDWHMTEFAACRRDHLCQQCLRGETNAKQHPWQRWTESKRENVLRRMAKALVKYVECGWEHACTKEDYDMHVRNSPARAVANEPLGDEYYTFAIQQCGGSFSQWRATNKRNDRLKFVFDNASKKERYEIAKVFFAAANDKDRLENGIEQWFEPEPNGVSFESRKVTRQLLVPDMLAWAVASIRARELTLRGRFVEIYQLAKIFVNTEHIKMGYISKQTLAQWE